MQVAQQLAQENSEVIVGRVDCTRFQSVASHFPVRGFPTILFINKDFMIEFDGDRSKEDILDFTRRLSGPPVRKVKDCEEIDILLGKHKVFFLHIGDEIPEHFSKTAAKYRSLSWFYHTSKPCLDSIGSFVIKGTTEQKLISRFDENSLASANTSMNQWVRQERFPHFVKITNGNINQVMRTDKILVIVVVEEIPSREKLANSKQEELRELLSAIALTYDTKEDFVFSWTPAVETLNSMTLQSVRVLPCLVLVNSTSREYAVFDEDQMLLPQSIIDILRNSSSGTLEWSGGNSYWTSIRRMIFDSIVSFVNMYHANPILTLLMFGLPLAFLSFIIYSAFFADFIDAPDDDEEGEFLSAWSIDY
jgi:hypothetical protein